MTPREQFLADRLTGIGGSDIHHLFNLPPYGCARRLSYEKQSIAPDYPVDETGPMRRGKLLEPIIADEYAEATGRTVETRPQLRHPDYPWAVVHIDRIVDGNRVLEIKSVGREMFYTVKREGLIDAYVLQVQHGMFVTRMDHGAFAVHEPGSWKLLHWDVERDDALIAEIVEVGSQFWTDLQAGAMPERLEPRSPQCQSCPYRTTCQGEHLLESMPQSTDEIPMVYDLAALVNDYAEIRALAAETEELKDAAKDALADEMGDRQAIDVPGFRVYFRPQATMRLNEAKVKDLVAAYNKLGTASTVRLTIEDLKTASISRPLRIYAR
jgi:putative phage-type endonuclease